MSENLKQGESMPNPENQEVWDSLASELDLMQKEKNSGRGDETVKSIIYYLRKGQPEVARAVCRSESDKFDNIQDIQEIIIEKLFKGLKHPWSFSWKSKNRKAP